MLSRCTFLASVILAAFVLVPGAARRPGLVMLGAQQSWTEPVMESLPVTAEPGELEELSLAVWDERDQHGRVVWSVSDYHLLVDVELRHMVAVLRDNDGNLGRLPNLLEYEWRLVSQRGPQRVIEERQETGFRFLGISATYDTSLRSVSVDRSGREPAAFELRFDMLESHDGKLRDTRGWYYLEERMVDGRPLTYFRQWTLLEIDRTFPLLPVILRRFTAGTSATVIEALADAARERAAAGAAQ